MAMRLVPPSPKEITRLFFGIVDWSENQDNTQTQTAQHERGLSAGLWFLPVGFPQTQGWKVGATLGPTVALDVDLWAPLIWFNLSCKLHEL